MAKLGRPEIIINFRTRSTSAITRSGRGAVSELSSKLNSLKNLQAQVQQFKELKKSAVATEQAFRKTNVATAQLKNQFADLKSSAQKLKGSGDEFKNLQSQIKAATSSLKANQAATRNIGNDLKAVTAGAKNAQRELNNIGAAFTQSKNKAAGLKQEMKRQQPELNRMRQSLAAQGFKNLYS